MARIYSARTGQGTDPRSKQSSVAVLMSENEALDRFSNKGLILPARGQTVANGDAMLRVFPSGAVILSLLLMYLGACSSGGTEVVDPGTVPGEPGDVPKPGLSMRVKLDSASLGLATVLGWTDGRIPDVEVILQRGGVITQRDTLRTDKTGSAGVEKLVPGQYKAWASRSLTPAERAQAAAAGWDVRVLGGGDKFPITGGPQQAVLQLSTDRPGSLVISEWYFTSIQPPGTTSNYVFSGYVEIYNNSDSTIFLDGKIFGAGWGISFDSQFRPCSDDRLRNDPLGIFARYVHAFPGSGTEHPLAPGAAVVVATDAIDHSALVEGGLDLSGADFEFFGPSDVDNPAVPNMIDVGLAPFFFGHGILFAPFVSTEVAFIAEPVDIAGLPVLFDPSSVASPRKFARYPADKIIDVATFRHTLSGDRFTECVRSVNVRFDRVEGYFFRGAAVIWYRLTAAWRGSGRTDKPFSSALARAPQTSWWGRSAPVSFR